MDAPDESMSSSAALTDGPVVLEACSGCYDLPSGWSETEHWRVSSSVGVEGLDVAMSVVMSSRQADVRDTLLRAIAECLDELNAHYDVLEPDAVRPLFTLLLLWVCAVCHPCLQLLSRSRGCVVVFQTIVLRPVDVSFRTAV